MTKIYIFLIAFIVAISLNTAIHFFHPAYKYYRENVELLRKDFVAFKDRVVFEMVPTINSINTNLTYAALSKCESNLITRLDKNMSKFSIAAKTKDILTVQNEEEQIKEIYVEDYHFQKYNKETIVTLYGNHYRIGDVLLGEVIVSIDPLITRTLHYHFLNKKLSQDRLIQ